MNSIFAAPHFVFPYLYKFPGQGSDEQILYVTREGDVMLFFRRLIIICTAGFIFLIGVAIGAVVTAIIGKTAAMFIELTAAIAAVLYFLLAWWWITTLWRKSIALITTKRLAKFVYTTPWNRHNLSLPLDNIVDTGAYSKGWVQALLRLGTFTARSSASSSGVATDDPARVNKKYFYIENIASFEDLHHYLNKVLFAYRQDWTKLTTFRPFLPSLKGDARKQFMEQYPQYWS